VTRLPYHPLIYLITTGTLTEANFSRRSSQYLLLFEEAVSAGISLIQIREKGLSDRLVFELARQAVERTRGSATKLLINDRADIAVASGADGVHLTAASVSPEEIRNAFTHDLIVGVSTHTIAEVEAASKQMADFAVFGPVYASPGKAELTGVTKLRAAVDRVAPFPVLALGGIDETNYGSALQCGAAGFAAIRYLNDVRNVRNLGVEFRMARQNAR
jgi:thiamine-phosphate pyrophosphorylase